MAKVSGASDLSMRARFASLGVSDEVLAQIIWAEWSDNAVDLSPAQMLQWAAGLLPDEAYQFVAAQLTPAVAEADSSARIVLLRRYG
jgi:hypothetical protein